MAVTYTASCPATAVTDQPILCNFSMISPAFFAGNETITITPSGAGTIALDPNGTLRGSSTGWFPSIGQTLYAFVLTADTIGVKTLHFTNNVGYTDPSDVTVTVSAHGSPPTFPASLTPIFTQAVPCPSDANVTSWTCSISPTAGNTLIVGVSLYNAASATDWPTIADNLGNSFVRDTQTSFHFSTIFISQAIFHLNVLPGVTSFTITRSTGNYSIAIAMEATNLDPNPLDFGDTAGNDFHSGQQWVSGPLITTNNADLIVGFAATSDSPSVTPGAGAPYTLAANAHATTASLSASLIYGLTPTSVTFGVNPGYYIALGELWASGGFTGNGLAVAYKAALVPSGGGQSLVLTPGQTSTSVAVPPLAQTQATRVEFQMHNWTAPSTQNDILAMDDVEEEVLLLTDGTTLRILSNLDSTSPSVCDLNLSGMTNALIRIQRNPSASVMNGVPAMSFLAEAWNWDSTLYNSCQMAITSFGAWPSPGGGRFGDAHTTADIGFYKVFNTLEAPGSQPPVTASLANCSTTCTNLTFNNSSISGDTFLDSSGNSHTVTWPTTPPTIATPNQVPVSLIKTFGAPSWTNQTSFRAGTNAQLDGSNSYSLAETSAVVTYFWQDLSCPSTPFWSSHTVSQPVLTGLTFGPCQFQLQVTDTNGNKATNTLDTGAVATDTNGVVVQANPQADQLFGPMIAFGRNPWIFQDQQNLFAGKIVASNNAAISPPTWATPLAGTITYWPFYAGTAKQTTVASPGVTNGSSLSVPITDASTLDLGTFPTIIQVCPPGSNIGNCIMEQMEIVSTTATSGPATLTVAYNGRGWTQAAFNQVIVPQAWVAGSTVTQLKTIGTGTHFLTDFCAAGPGEQGVLKYNIGTVAATAGSHTITGTGTAWTGLLANSGFNPGDNVTGLYRIRIQGTHSSTPFVFFASIESITDDTTIVMGTCTGNSCTPSYLPWPSDADTASGLTYQIIIPGRNISAGWQRPDNTIGQENMPISACFTDTLMYQTAGDSIANYVITQQSCPALMSTGCKYSYSDTTWESEQGPNYYDYVLANYASWLRSGLNMYLTSARQIGDYWPTMPEIDEGYVVSTPRHQGLTGMVAGAILDGRNNWYTIRNFANFAIASTFSAGAILSPCTADVREQAYGSSWLMLSALFDPDSGQKATWNTQVPLAYTRDSGCVASNGSFSQPFYFPGSVPGVISLTNGSAAGTGTGLTSNICNVAATGMINVTNGSADATGSGFIPIPTGGPLGGQIVIKGSYMGGYRLWWGTYIYNSPTSITLQGTNGFNAPWNWDNGTYAYQIENDRSYLSFATGVTDTADLLQDYVCTYNSSTSITLDRVWAGSTGPFNVSRDNQSGYGTQPFLNGVKTFSMRYAAIGTSTAASSYTTQSGATANWVLTEGYDPITGGLYYARTFYNCEPNTPLRIDCTYGSPPQSQENSRTLSGEAQNAMGVAGSGVFLNTVPSSINLTFGDNFYGAQWGNSQYSCPFGATCDGNYLQPATWNFKWYGFLFGIGMSHQWPAARLGGVQPVNLVNRTVSCNLAAVTGATQVKVTVTAPSGAMASPVACGSCPCAYQIDSRMGASNVALDYWSSGALLKHGTSLPVN